MKKILLYSTKTGNTKKIADVIAKEINPDYFGDVAEFDALNIDSEDLIIIGGWIDKGLMNKEVMDFITKLNKKNVAFYFTLGAYPNSMHAFDCINNIKKSFTANENNILAHYHCQGAIDPKLIEWMNNLPSEHSHSPDENRINRWNDAKSHPNQEDFNSAKNFVSIIEKKLGELNV
ncbi:MAG: flavodoxin family protein [Bacilli bacterium]